jgi:hypothetical protein
MNDPPDGAVFLSASVPDPRRDPRYFLTADTTAIREAVRALVRVVTARRLLVFGGHPAISPFVLHMAMSDGVSDRVVIYVSEFFRPVVPRDSLAFPHIVWTQAVDGDRAKSLAHMRDTMFGGHDFRAGVFVGGMDGVEEEFARFHARWPAAPVYPVASTGAAARFLFERGEGPQDTAMRAALEGDLVYGALFEGLPGVG